jgi:hypothetical protein
MFKNYSLNRLLVLFTTIGFLFLMVDSIIEHWSAFSQEIMCFIPVAFGAIGLVVGTLTVRQWKDQWIRRFHILLFTTFVVSAAGLYFHIIEEEDDEQLTAEQREHEKTEKEKPLLAPLTFAGLAAVGLIGTSRKWQAEVI